MVLVGYSDSEGSDNESTPVPTTKPAQAVKPTAPTNFAADKSNPKKIRVSLNESLVPRPSTNGTDGEPPAKRPRVGAGTFAGFNAMLPAPKRDNMSSNPVSTNGTANKAPARKVFSLKTGAEPAFSRDHDTDVTGLSTEDEIASSIPKPAFIEEKKDRPTPGSGSGSGTGTGTGAGKPFMFKPLSVSRNTKKKKASGATSTATATSQPNTVETALTQQSAAFQKPPGQQVSSAVSVSKKERISLFLSGPPALPPDSDETPTDERGANDEEDEIVEVLGEEPTSTYAYQTSAVSNQPESLDSIANSLNLSAAERRQLFGRGKNNASAGRVINFNTDAEYIANQQMNAAGEQVQHNPVRAIAPGKHSLKSLVASAQGQKDALEEAFATGRKNKREAGSKYGW